MWSFGHDSPKRRGFGKYQQQEILARQRNRCHDCGKMFGRIKPRFHHVDLERSNNETSNGMALCGTCHDIRHANQPRKKKSDSMFDLDW